MIVYYVCIVLNLWIKNLIFIFREIAVNKGHITPLLPAPVEVYLMEWTTHVPQVKTRVRNRQRVRGNIGRKKKDYQDNSVIKKVSERDSQFK